MGFDKEINDSYVDVLDAFDLMIMPCDHIEQSPFVIKTFVKTLEEYKSNKEYANTSKISTDSKMAASDMKEARLSEKFGGGNSGEEKVSTAVGKELWMKIHRDGRTQMRVVTTAGGQTLRDKVIDRSDYPFVLLKGHTGSIYQPSWIEKFISVNKSLDVFVSQIENYTNTMVRGRYFKQKASSISRVTTDDGEFIEYDTIPPQQQEIISLPSYLFAHIGNLEKWIEESGVSTVALGRIPRGIRAAKAIDSLKQSDYANLRVLVANIQTTIQELTDKVVKIAATNYLLPQNVYRTDEEEQPDNFSVLGEAGKDLAINQSAINGEKPPVIISKDIKVRAMVVSGISYTEEGKRETLRELYASGVIPLRTLLQAYNFSNVGDIIQQLEAEGNISMVDTADFKALPVEIQEVILQYLNSPQAEAANPIVQNQQRTARRTQARKSMPTSL